MKRIFLIWIIVALLFTGQSELYAQWFSPVKARHAMVVSADSLASAVGLEMIKKGGNAVDASVAVAFTLAVTYPHAGNIGGGGFMLIRTPNNKVFALDYRETAPLKASRDMYLNAEGEVIPDASLIGYKACGVPGTVYGMWQAHKRFGKLKWKELLEPAVRLAENGFRINALQAAMFKHHTPKMLRFPETARIFYPNGQPLKEGDLLIQKDLAETLKRIQKYGLQDFYRGQTAQKIAADMQGNGGLITLKDLQKYRAVWRKPVKIDYKGYTVYSMSLPSSGGILMAEILNTLSFFNPAVLGHNSARYIQLLTEIERQAYHDRAVYLGDPDFVSAPVARLTSRAYADSIRCHLSLLHAGKSKIDSIGQIKEGSQTTHFSVYDASGWAVSNTYTLNGIYGSGVVIKGTGILMNNEMDDFSIKPGQPNQFGLIGNEANAIAPQKRMLSSMSPSIVLHNDSLFMVVGSPGGSTIITSVVQTILNAIEFKMNIRRAIEAPRFHHQWLPDLITLEQFGFNVDTINNLKNLGYRLKFVDQLGFVQGIMLKQQTIYGWGDPRGTGIALGF